MGRTDSLEKALMLGKIEGRRRRGQQRWLYGITDSMNMNLSKLQELVMDRDTWHASVHGVTKSQTWPSNWTELMTVSDHLPCLLRNLFVGQEATVRTPYGRGEGQDYLTQPSPFSLLSAWKGEQTSVGTGYEVTLLLFPSLTQKSPVKAAEHVQTHTLNILQTLSYVALWEDSLV